ncbi:MAG: HIT family protein [Advenella sp.]|uniref:Diadenosine tetraphosphate hydrolase n=1 Tax=Advenella kashmirensis TaxID=310575 RepID=A0A356LEA6_9BURK|nr:diadenosine tetraphosphate hydrolase [Advenella kashmirensis]
MTTHTECPLCHDDGATVLFRNAFLRVIDAQEADYPAFTRVILNRHAQEMTDLNQTERSGLMSAVYLVEALQRRHFQPDKINLAQLGNMVPHVHWHIIARFADDKHFPNPIWGMPRETANTPDGGHATACARRNAQIRQHLPAYHQDITQSFTALFDEVAGTVPEQTRFEQTLQRITDR